MGPVEGVAPVPGQIIFAWYTSNGQSKLNGYLVNIADRVQDYSRITGNSHKKLAQ
jgi:hypothetical protein